MKMLFFNHTYCFIRTMEKTRVLSLLAILLFSTTLSFGQLSDEEIRNLKTGRVRDLASPVYCLPYHHGSRYLFVQGANSSFSHQHELSFDFKMASGSTICAAREGVVVAVKEDSDRGGLKNEYLSDGNHVIIRHTDGSMAQYWHLQQNGVLVNEGDSVIKGQPIGLSGNTGYSAFPHLHFQVTGTDGKDILPRFQTKKGIIFLRPGRWYKAVHVSNR